MPLAGIAAFCSFTRKRKERDEGRGQKRKRRGRERKKEKEKAREIDLSLKTEEIKQLFVLLQEEEMIDNGLQNIRKSLGSNTSKTIWSGVQYVYGLACASTLISSRLIDSDGVRNTSQIHPTFVFMSIVKRKITKQTKARATTYSSSSFIAFLATVWNACSTLMASLALVSKYGIFPFDAHQARAFFWLTTREFSKSILLPNTMKGKFSGSLGPA